VSAPSTGPSRRIKSVYRSRPDGEILLYGGDLEFSKDGSSWTAPGDITFSLDDRAVVAARFAGNDQWMLEVFGEVDQLEVALPTGADLTPPEQSAVPAQPNTVTPWVRCDDLRINRLIGGDPGLAERIVIHVTGSLGDHHQWPEVDTDEGRQDQLSFDLPGWTLVMAAVEPDEQDVPFSYVIEAAPHPVAPITEELIGELNRRVFVLSSFIRGTTIGVYPCVGVDAAGSVVWAQWSSPRIGRTYSRHRWCWDGLVHAALPGLAAGITPLLADEGLERCIERAIALQLGANNGDVELDLRIPLACTGLELVAWSVLQHRGWLTSTSKLAAAARLRLLLQWARIPIDVPADFTRLLRRRAAFLPPDSAGPEVVFEIRNKLVHPPRSLRDPEWPHPEELVEAWQLATWYLELAILKVLGYTGPHTSRLKMTGWVGETEPVPWTE